MGGGISYYPSEGENFRRDLFFLNATQKKEALSHETIACMLSGRRDASHLLNKGH